MLTRGTGTGALGEISLGRGHSLSRLQEREEGVGGKMCDVGMCLILLNYTLKND